MRLKRPYVASLDQVRIGRHGDEAVIAYVEPGVWTQFRLGPEVQRMTDQEILDRFNELIEMQQRMRDEPEHVAIEIPPSQRSSTSRRATNGPHAATCFAALPATADPATSPSSTSTSMICPRRSSAAS